MGKYARATTRQDCVRRTRPHQPTNLDPCLDYLRQRWEEGEHTATVLHQAIAAKGYSGHYQRVKMAIAPLRRGLPLDIPRDRPPSPRDVARWITTVPSRRSLHAAEALRRLFEQCPELNRTHDLVRQFAAMPETRDATLLPDWLDELATSRLPALTSLAKAIREDQPAVVQGITTTGGTWPGVRRELQRIHLGTFTGPAGTFQQVNGLTKPQRDLLAKLQIPASKQVVTLQPAPR